MWGFLSKVDSLIGDIEHIRVVCVGEIVACWEIGFHQQTSLAIDAFDFTRLGVEALPSGSSFATFCDGEFHMIVRRER